MDGGSVAAVLSLGVIVHAGIAYFKKSPEASGPFLTRWNPLEAVTVTIASYLLSQLLAGLAIYALFGEGRGDGVDQTVLSFVSTALFEAATVLLLAAFLRRRRATRRSIGLVRTKWDDVLYALAGYGAYYVALLITLGVVKALLPQIDLNQPQELGFDTTASGSALILIFVSLVILPPIIEEIVCRGFLYSGLRSRLAILPAALLTSFIFGLAHLQFGSGNALLYVAAIDTFLLSMVLVYLREKTGGLSAPIMLHAIKNCFAFLALFIFQVV